MEGKSKDQLVASSLGRFSKEEQLFLSPVFDRCHLTVNQLTRVAEWLSDLKKIKKTTLEEILKEESLQKILQHPSMDRKAKGERFFERVRLLRFPEVSKSIKASSDEFLL